MLDISLMTDSMNLPNIVGCKFEQMKSIWKIWQNFSNNVKFSNRVWNPYEKSTRYDLHDDGDNVNPQEGRWLREGHPIHAFTRS